MRSDLVFYIKRMGNQLERMSYQYGQAAGNREISLMNLWVVDFLFDNQDREIFPREWAGVRTCSLPALSGQLDEFWK